MWGPSDGRHSHLHFFPGLPPPVYPMGISNSAHHLPQSYAPPANLLLFCRSFIYEDGLIISQLSRLEKPLILTFSPYSCQSNQVVKILSSLFLLHFLNLTLFHFYCWVLFWVFITFHFNDYDSFLIVRQCWLRAWTPSLLGELVYVHIRYVLTSIQSSECLWYSLSFGFLIL